MDIASPNTEEITTARWFVMRAYKSEKRAEEKLKGKDGLEYFKQVAEIEDYGYILLNQQWKKAWGGGLYRPANTRNDGSKSRESLYRR